MPGYAPVSHAEIWPLEIAMPKFSGRSAIHIHRLAAVHIHRGKQIGGSVALVIVGLAAQWPGAQGKPGCVRLSAWS